MDTPKITRLKSAQFRRLARQRRECMAYCQQAERIGNFSGAYWDRMDELSCVDRELEDMGAWDCPLYYE